MSANASNTGTAWLPQLTRAGKILFICLVIYVIGFFFVFFDTFFWGVGEATSSNKEPSYKYIVGPTPNGFLVEGTPDRGAANGTRRYTGKEWPFVVYRPLVTLYNRRHIPEVKKMEDELIKGRKGFIR